MTRVIERSTEDIEKEDMELFLKCKPLLDEGKGFYESIRIVKGIPKTSAFGNCAWYKRFKKIAESQGYKSLR